MAFIIGMGLIALLLMAIDFMYYRYRSNQTIKIKLTNPKPHELGITDTPRKKS